MYLLCLALALSLMTWGCAEQVLTQWPRQAIFSNYFRLQEVKRGMSRSEVEGIMGQPMIKEEGDYRGGHYVFYLYRTHNMDFEGSETVRGGFTPLVFQKDRLVGLGKRDYRMAVERPYGEESPDLPWKRTQ